MNGSKVFTSYVWPCILLKMKKFLPRIIILEWISNLVQGELVFGEVSADENIGVIVARKC